MKRAKEAARPIYPEELDSQAEEIENLIDNEPARFEPGERGDIESMDSDRELVSDEEFESQMLDCEGQVKPEDEADSLAETEELFKPEKDSNKAKESDRAKTAEDDIVSKIEKDLERGLEKAKEIKVHTHTELVGSDHPKTAEEASQNHEEFLRLTQPNWTDKQIIIALDNHRVKNLGLPPLAEANLTQKVRDWIELTKGEFQTREVFDELNIPRSQKAHISVILTRLISEDLIERTGKRTGYFRLIEKDVVIMDIFNTETKTVNLTLPFGIHEMVTIMPGNVIIIAGAKDAGKTALLLNITADNLAKFNVHYFNSEMAAGELRARLKLFEDLPFEEWKKVTFYERDEHFSDLIVPGEGNLNIIDFLEIYEDFWIVKKRIAEIWRNLNGAIAIIALQKPQGRDIALGGEGSIEKARLALAMEAGKLKIVSGKNWKNPKENPKGKVINFKLASGCKFIETDTWSLE